MDYEQLQTDLYALHDAPIDLNNTSDEELSQLYFLSPQQIDDILAYAGRHPFESLYELRLIPSLAEYEIRDLLPFVQIRNHKSEIINQKLYPREVFAHATHEVITRVDARNIEGVEGTDPMYVQGRYRFDYQRKVIFRCAVKAAGGRCSEGPAVRRLSATTRHDAPSAHGRWWQFPGLFRAGSGARAGLSFRQEFVCLFRRHAAAGPAVLLVGRWRRTARSRSNNPPCFLVADTSGCLCTLLHAPRE